MPFDVGDPQTFVPMAALAGAAVAGVARHAPMLRVVRVAFGSSVRTWISGWALGAALVAATAVLEAIYLDGDTWQYLGTVLMAYFAVMAWAVAGAVVGVAALLRTRLPVLEPIVHVAVAGTLAVGLAFWIWFAAFGIPMASS